MTDMITAEEAQKLLDGTTPGPWEADGNPQNRIVWSPDGNRVCFMAHSSGLNDDGDIANSNLVAAAPDLARTCLALMAQLEDAKMAQALVLERAERAARQHISRVQINEPIWHEGQDWAADRIARAIRALADADGLAAVEALRAESRESAMQALASMGQAQEAYEAQLKAEAERDSLAAELAASRAREADDWDDLIAAARVEAEKAMRKFPQPNYVISKIAEEAGEVVKAAIHCAEGRETVENLRGEMKQVIAMLYRLWIEGDHVHGLPPVGPTALAEVQARDDASTPPDTWHERRTMLPDGDARKEGG